MNGSGPLLRLPRAVILTILAIELVLCLAGLAIFFGKFPAGMPVVDALPPSAGLIIAAVATLSSAAIRFLSRSPDRPHDRSGGTIQ